MSARSGLCAAGPEGSLLGHGECIVCIFEAYKRMRNERETERDAKHAVGLRERVSRCEGIRERVPKWDERSYSAPSGLTICPHLAFIRLRPSAFPRLSTLPRLSPTRILRHSLVSVSSFVRLYADERQSSVVEE